MTRVPHQERVKFGHIALKAVAGEKNVADVLTKVTAATRLTEVLGKLGFWTSMDPGRDHGKSAG